MLSGHGGGGGFGVEVLGELPVYGQVVDLFALCEHFGFELADPGVFDGRFADPRVGVVDELEADGGEFFLEGATLPFEGQDLDASFAIVFLGFLKLGVLLLDPSIAVTGFLAQFLVIELAALLPVFVALDGLVHLLLLVLPKLFRDLAFMDICRKAFDCGLRRVSDTRKEACCECSQDR